MPAYTYVCGQCGEEQEKYLSFADYVATQPCVCGATATRDFSDMEQIQVINRGAQRDFKLDWTDRPIHWEKGNTDCQKQEDRYTKLIETNRAAAKRNKSTATKRGMRLIGQVPTEIVRTRRRQFGKDYFAPGTQSPAELKDKLRSEGLLYE